MALAVLVAVISAVAAVAAVAACAAKNVAGAGSTKMPSGSWALLLLMRHKKPPDDGSGDRLCGHYSVAVAHVVSVLLLFLPWPF